MTQQSIEFFFDFSCPYAYLGSTQIETIASAAGRPLRYRPMLLGGVFQALGTPQNLAAALHPAKARHNFADMHRWADVWNVPFSMPAGHPLRTVSALRAVLAAPEAAQPALIHRLYAAYWARGEDISNPDVLAAIVAELGLPAAVAGPFTDETKNQLRANTEEALQRGVFGAPTVFVDGALYWGQDRLWQVAHAAGVAEAQGPLAHVPEGGTYSGEPPREFDFWYDFSSPFTYLAATQIEGIEARTGARANWRPFLLGGLFKTIGGPTVPLSQFSAPKARFVQQDMQRWADYWQVPYHWPSRFPMMTVLPLRVAVALGQEALPFVLRCFRAYWAEDQDISSPEVVGRLLEEVGAAATALQRASEPAVKSALVSSTDAAAAAGLFGAPAVTVGSRLYWGQDRLGFVEKALRGWNPPAQT